MAHLCLFLSVVLVSTALGLDYVVDPDKSAGKQEFQGVGIGMVSRPSFCERTTQRGDKLKVHFNASMGDGKIFESTSEKKKPFEFVIGGGQVIAGFEYGLMDMCIGEKRHLTVPSKYAYGATTFGAKVPARITLYFDVELVDFERMPNPPRKSNSFRVIDINDDGLLSKEEVQRYVRNSKLDDHRGEEGIAQVLKEIFQEEDRDKDGFIDHGEFSGIKHDEF